MSDKKIEPNDSLPRRISRVDLTRLGNATKEVSNYPIQRSEERNAQLGNREKIGRIDTEPKAISSVPEGLTPQEQEMREAVLQRFNAKKVSEYITDQMKHINSNQDLADGIRFLFDERGRPPANAPLEDIIAAREKIESDIRMLEAICSAMRNRLARIREVEDMAFELIGGQNKK
jgi:hypothetical protein